jgi:hypothetical protein
MLAFKLGLKLMGQVTTILHSLFHFISSINIFLKYMVFNLKKIEVLIFENFD